MQQWRSDISPTFKDSYWTFKKHWTKPPKFLNLSACEFWQLTHLIFLASISLSKMRGYKPCNPTKLFIDLTFAVKLIREFLTSQSDLWNDKLLFVPLHEGGKEAFLWGYRNFSSFWNGNLVLGRLILDQCAQSDFDFKVFKSQSYSTVTSSGRSTLISLGVAVPSTPTVTHIPALINSLHLAVMEFIVFIFFCFLFLFQGS